ncbi:MAG: serine/threonine-protein kinase [Gemmatimonadota bacterium]
MANPNLVGPFARNSTPAGMLGWRSPRRDLPPDLLREASRRLSVISLLGAVLWIVGSIADHIVLHVMEPANPGWNVLNATDGIALALTAISLGLFFYSRNTTRQPRFILDLGLGYLVLTTLALGLLIHLDPPPKGWPVFPIITWVGVVLIMFAAIVPSTPRKTLVVGLIAASMNPLSMLLARARGTWHFASASDVLLMHYPDYMLVGVAVVISHVVSQLGHQVTKARELGSYQLGELLGRGGMGEVYRATHRMFARPAAIKLIRPDMVGAENSETAQLAVARFRREAEAAANLRSPHTVELYDFGVTDDQTLYFVMELLDGMDLETMVRRYGPLNASRIIHIMNQVCDSLEEAHARGLVHRDVKPANIHLGLVGLRHDFVKVLDFGLVKSFAGGNSDLSMGTAAGLTPGTPSYMAPEMALGETVDGRADLYALGCVAYYLLTGQLVFEATSGVQMIARHVRAEPIPPSIRANMVVAPALERLILDCLAKKPEDRPGTAAEIARRLSTIDLEPWTEDLATTWWVENHPSPGGQRS